MAAVVDVAQYINDKFWSLRKVKLHKLLYFCQVWHLATTGNELFPEEFEAWKLGPVVAELHRRLHESEKFVPIDIPGANIENLNNGDILHIDKVLDFYGDMSSDELVELTHQDDPWRRAKQDEVITKESILAFYKGKLCPL